MNPMTNENLEARLHREYELLKQSVKKPNILILGATGSGKSTLVNSIFGRDLALTGSGAPVTESISKYSASDAAVTIYDTRGYEVGSEEQRRFLTEAVHYARNCRRSPEPENHIHVVWYCIQASGHRILDVDIQTVKGFNDLGIPAAIVLTKGDLVTAAEEEELKADIGLLAPSVPIFLTSHRMLPGLSRMDLNLLSQWSMDQLPAGLRTAFLSAQKTSLDVKKKEAATFIAQHVAGAFTVGFTPIPVADAPILVSNQMAMIARILYIYDLEYMLKSMQRLVAGVGAGKLVSGFGVWSAGQLAKIVPGLGTITGGLINGSVASAITAALGHAVSGVCYQINLYTVNNERQKLADFIANLDQNFQNLFAKKYSK